MSHFKAKGRRLAQWYIWQSHMGPDQCVGSRLPPTCFLSNSLLTCPGRAETMG